MVHVYEWSGSVLGLIGAFLLATNTRISRFGWVAFAAANVAMIAFATCIDARGLLLQQAGFTITSLLGLYRNGFFSWLSRKPENVPPSTATETIG